jgi:NADPH:quinone reductase
MIRVRRSGVIDEPIEQVWAILRDFNSHWAWHPALADSYIENNEPSDQIGCVRNFRLKDGNRLREQLLSISDDKRSSTYCILDATLPMKRYVATLALKKITDSNHTFWHWESSFDVPSGRESEFDQLVGDGVYIGGFQGLKAYLRQQGSVGRDPSLIGLKLQTNMHPAHLAAPLDGSVTRTHHLGPGSPNNQIAIAQARAIQGMAVIATDLGGPEVFKYQIYSAAAPGPGEVRIQQTAIGVNYIDVYVRKGLYPMLKPPGPLGMEAAGVVIDLGPGVTHLLPGDRVAYACAPVGAYVTVRTLTASQVVVIPPGITDEQAACLMLKGQTAEYLLHRVKRVMPRDWVLVHAAAGGVGLMLCSWAKSLGARVIGTVSSDTKAKLSREYGCEHTIVSRDYRFASTVNQLTEGQGVSVIYDGLGREAQKENMDSLALCGHWVSYGQASGPAEAIAMEALSSKSITLTRPVLFHYTAQRSALEIIAKNTFAAFLDGRLRMPSPTRYPLASAAAAHRALETRQTTGPLLLLP